ncbi:MAG: trypsin-like peptidase domain-containing protein [Planctomycetota bacterium]|nr:trypsin-like peptidase domain-containing protein [Planctomycetota bacterium]MDI6787531.1 trypsin-like peptidase domain-containing protein [Planctomycetota bacterium]
MKRVFVIFILVAIFSGSLVSQEKPLSKHNRSIDFESIIENAKEKVFPTLVYVKPTIEEYERGKRKQVLVAGSGVIISPDGYIVTNNHVIEKATRIKCVLFDRRFLSAKLIGRDKSTDLALIKLEPEKEGDVFPYAEFGDSDELTEGHFVMALGAPWGLERSISLGIVGNARRYLGDNYSEYSLWIQSDASLNPGNSGGPLINTSAKIVGINTLGTFFGGDMGFSVPSNTVKRVVEHLKKDGEIRRSWTGIRLQPLRDLDKETFFNSDKGVLLASVDDNSPCQRAGLQAGDLILKINNKEINGVYDTDIPEIRWFLGALPINVESDFLIKRSDQLLTIKVTPREKGKVEGDDFDCKRWDFTVKEINEFETPDLFIYRKQGVYIQGIQYPGNGSNAGLSYNDIIIKIDKQEILSMDDIKKAYEKIMADEKREKKVLVEILRGGKPMFIILKYHTDYDKE